MSQNNISSPAMHETIWFDKPRYDDAERRFYEQQARNAGRGDVRSAGKGTNSAQVVKEGSSVQVKKEVSSMQVKKEASNVHGKKGASGTQAKKGASGAQAKKEVSSVQAKKEVSSVQAKKEANIVQAKKEASNVQDKKDASNMQSTEEATSAPSKVFEAEVSTVSLANEIASVRDRITNTIKAAENVQFEHADSFGSLNEKVEQLSRGHAEIAAKVERLFQFFKAVHNMESKIESLNSYLQNLEEKLVNGGILESEAKSQNHVEDDDDIDLFGSDEDDEETSKLRETRLKAYEDKKSKKVPVLAKSFVVFDVKPWTDETDLKEMERLVREVKTDGLVWGQSKLVPVAYGINSLKIGAVVEDDKVSIDWLQETLQDIENHVQSVDIVAFNKV